MWSRLGLVLGSLALLFLLLEVALRVAERVSSVDLFHVLLTGDVATETTELRMRDFIRLTPNQELMYELDPKVVGRFKGEPLGINADGFRGPRIPLQREDPEALRIVGLGDSVLFGWGVSEPASTLGRIRAMLAERHPEGPPVETLNLSAPGYNTHQEVELFASRGLAYDPDLVLVIFVPNDDLIANAFHHRPSFFTTTRSYLLDFVEVRVKLLIRGDEFHNRYKPRGLAGLRDVRPAFANYGGEDDPVPEEYLHMVGFEAVERGLRRLAELVSERDVSLVFSWISPATPLTLRAAAVARELGFQVVDMDRPISDYLVETGSEIRVLEVADDDAHPNELGHQLMADALLEEAIEPWFESRQAARSAARPGAAAASR